MRVRKQPGYLPHSVVENLLGLHPAIDPDTGHILCHYKPFNLGLAEINGNPYPALIVNDCIIIINDNKAVKELIEETIPLKTSMLPPKGEDHEGIPIYELADTLSLLKDYSGLELRKFKEADSRLVLIFRGEQVLAIIMEKCRQSDDRGTILQV